MHCGQPVPRQGYHTRATTASVGVAAVMIVSRLGVAVYAAVLLVLSLTRPSLNKLLVATMLHRGTLLSLIHI